MLRDAETVRPSLAVRRAAPADVALIAAAMGATEQEARDWKRVLVCEADGRVVGAMIGHARHPLYVRWGLAALVSCGPLLRRLPLLHIDTRGIPRELAMTDAEIFVDKDCGVAGVSAALLRYANGAPDAD